MSNGVYDNYTPPKPKDPVKAGRVRAATALRDEWGRMLPNDGSPLPPPQYHGVRGGILRSMRGKRDKKGRYTK